nr:hypothetical protein [Tanacetum cinerariifolium]
MSAGTLLIFQRNGPALEGLSPSNASNWQDQAKRKAKAGTSSTSSTIAFDVKSLAKLLANDSYNVQKGHEMTELLRIKKQELELKDAELEIRRL